MSSDHFKNRWIKKPKNPAIVPIFVNLLERFSKNVSDKNQFEISFGNALSKFPDANKIVSGLVDNFYKIPQDIRQNHFQEFSNLGVATISTAIIKEQFKKIPKSNIAGSVFSGVPNGAIFHSNDDVYPPSYPPLMKLNSFYNLDYTGFKCLNETTWDRGSDSDEIYFITSVVEVINGENIVRTEKHPISLSHFSDVDDGEYQYGPVAACWRSKNLHPTEISLVCTVMERDEGDPNYYKKEIEILVKAAADLITMLSGNLVPASFKELAVSVINYLVGSGDDLISTEVRVLSEGEMYAYGKANQYLLEGTTNVAHHFSTLHIGSGAKYKVAFRIRREYLQPIDITQ